MNSCPSAGRRAAFGLVMASHDSASSAVKACISRFNSGSSVFWSGNSTEASTSAADRIAGSPESRVGGRNVDFSGVYERGSVPGTSAQAGALRRVSRG